MGREIIKLRVDDILAERHMTKAELAQRIGVNKTYLYNVLAKNKEMSLNALVSVAEGLNVDFSEIFARPEKENNPALDALKRLLVSELSFPRDALPRNVGSYLDALRESMHRDNWLAFVSKHVKGFLTEPLFENSRMFMKSETASDVAAIING